MANGKSVESGVLIGKHLLDSVCIWTYDLTQPLYYSVYKFND